MLETAAFRTARVTPPAPRPRATSPSIQPILLHPTSAARHPFPLTRISVVAGLAAADDEVRGDAADLLARAYWGPVAALLQFRWRQERADAEDLTQEFFATALEKGWFRSYDPGRGRFRTFLRVCLDRFVAGDARARSRLKRGGGAVHESIDAADAIGGPDETDARIRAEWVRAVLALALDAFRAAASADGKGVRVALFEAYDVEDPPDERRPSYRALAERFGLPESQVTNHLHWARREYRRHVLDALRALAGNDAEFREDARDLLGGRPA